MNFIDSLLKLNVAITSRQWIVHALKRPHFKKEMGWGLINFFSTFLKRNNLKLINILPSLPPKLGFTLFSVFLKDILFFFLFINIYHFITIWNTFLKKKISKKHQKKTPFNYKLLKFYISEFSKTCSLENSQNSKKKRKPQITLKLSSISLYLLFLFFSFSPPSPSLFLSNMT